MLAAQLSKYPAYVLPQLAVNRFLSVLRQEYHVVFAIVLGFATLSYWPPEELAGSWRPLFSLHAGTAEPLRISPPEPVVYQDLIRNALSDCTCPTGRTDPSRTINQKDVLSRHANLVKKSPSRANLAFRVLRAVINYFDNINADKEGFQLKKRPRRARRCEHVDSSATEQNEAAVALPGGLGGIGHRNAAL
jgi:hypothetical protein